MLSTDSAALEYAFDRFSTDIYAFFMSRLHDRHDAEDLTQQTFADAAAAIGRGAAPRVMKTWLFSVAQRRFADELRRRAKAALPADVAVQDEAPLDPGVARALEQLSLEDRRLLFLRFVAEDARRDRRDRRMQRGRLEDARLARRAAPAARARDVTKP